MTIITPGWLRRRREGGTSVPPNPWPDGRPGTVLYTVRWLPDEGLVRTYPDGETISYGAGWAGRAPR